MTTTLFRNVAYFDPDFNVRRADILVSGSHIKSLTPPGETLETSDDVVEGKEFLVSPGFVNAHFHSQTCLCLGLTKQERAGEGRDDLRSDLEEKFTHWVDEAGSIEDFEVVCLQSYCQLLRNGVTTTQDSGYGERSSNSLQRCLEILSMRGVLDAYDNILDRIGSTTELVSYGGHLPEEEDLVNRLEDSASLVRRLNVRLFTHCLETAERRRLAMDEYGRSPLELFEATGVLDERTVLFHGVYVDANDIERISSARAHIVHCPVSNARFGNGIAPLGAMLDAGINVALGTDWAFTDVWENMRLAWYLAHAQGNSLTAQCIWKMATQGGAKSLGLNTGELLEGRLADIILLDLSAIQLQPLIDRDGFSTVAHNLLLEGNAKLVRDVMIGGQWVIRNGSNVRVDVGTIEERYRSIKDAIYSS